MLGVRYPRNRNLAISVENVLFDLFCVVVSELSLPMPDLLLQDGVITIDQDHAFRIFGMMGLPSGDHAVLQAISTHNEIMWDAPCNHALGGWPRAGLLSQRQ